MTLFQMSKMFLQNELPVDGARVISIDASNQKILVSGRATAIGAEYVLTKVYNLKFLQCQMNCGAYCYHFRFTLFTLLFFYFPID